MTPHPTKTKSEEDHKAAYLNALMWNITKMKRMLKSRLRY